MLFVMLNSSAICAAAGATMEEDTGDMKAKAETVMAAAHFFFDAQLPYEVSVSHILYNIAAV